MSLFDKVKEQLAQCVVSNAEDVIPADGDAYFGLPKPYSVPTPGCTFRELYYWDTYFTNVGFLAVGNVEQAKNNAENILYLIEHCILITVMFALLWKMYKDKAWIIFIQP